jgi:hypothetical protein
MGDHIWSQLVAAGEEQKGHLRAADPALLFFDMLAGAIASGEAHLSPANSPERQPGEFDAPAWGWRKVKKGGVNRVTGYEYPRQYAPQGRRIGYADPNSDEALLIGPAAYRSPSGWPRSKTDRSRSARFSFGRCCASASSLRATTRGATRCVVGSALRPARQSAERHIPLPWW